MEYLLSKTDKYLIPSNAIEYAQVKAENDFQGQIGAAVRLGELSFHRTFAKNSSVRERNFDLDAIMSNLVQAAFEMKLSPKEFGYRTNENVSVDLFFPNCFIKDVSRQASDEELLKRPDGRFKCSTGSTMCQYLKVATGYEWDYDCLEFDKPHCISRCYMF
ncbi:MAG: hypothetical protein ACETWM_08335 [Candidatus Lokiarchaeia archaeon]